MARLSPSLFDLLGLLRWLGWRPDEQLCTCFEMDYATRMAQKQTEVSCMVMYACTQCGAGLPADLQAKSSRCGFCGKQNQLSANAHSAQLVVNADAERIEGEAHYALREVLLERFGPNAITDTIVSVVQLAVPPVVITFAVLVGDVFQVNVLISFALGFLLSIVPSYFLAKKELQLQFVKKLLFTEYRVQRKLNAILKELAGHPENGKCPNCGAPIFAPPQTVVMTCRFCNEALLATSGMLSRWTQLAHERVTEFRRLAKFHSRLNWLMSIIHVLLSPVLVMGAVMGFLSVLYGCLLFAEWVHGPS
jgi:hypothetical protein